MSCIARTNARVYALSLPPPKATRTTLRWSWSRCGRAACSRALHRSAASRLAAGMAARSARNASSRTAASTRSSSTVSRWLPFVLFLAGSSVCVAALQPGADGAWLDGSLPGGVLLAALRHVARARAGPVREDVEGDIRRPMSQHAEQRVGDAVGGLVDTLQVTGRGGRLIEDQPILAGGIDPGPPQGIGPPAGPPRHLPHQPRAPADPGPA